MKKNVFAKIALIAAAGFAVNAFAATNPATASFQVLMKISKSCIVTAGNGSNIQIGATGGVDATTAVGLTGTNSISVNCANKATYNIALQSTNNASTAGLGTLKSVIVANTDTITYRLNSGSAAGPIWGNSGVTAVATGNGLAGTGNGTTQTIAVYATTTATNPAAVSADDYVDTVTVSVYF